MSSMLEATDGDFISSKSGDILGALDTEAKKGYNTFNATITMDHLNSLSNVQKNAILSVPGMESANPGVFSDYKRQERERMDLEAANIMRPIMSRIEATNKHSDGYNYRQLQDALREMKDRKRALHSDIAGGIRSNGSVTSQIHGEVTGKLRHEANRQLDAIIGGLEGRLQQIASLIKAGVPAHIARSADKSKLEEFEGFVTGETPTTESNTALEKLLGGYY